jgi:hypothetical protein
MVCWNSSLDTIYFSSASFHMDINEPQTSEECGSSIHATKEHLRDFY